MSKVSQHIRNQIIGQDHDFSEEVGMLSTRLECTRAEDRPHLLVRRYFVEIGYQIHTDGREDPRRIQEEAVACINDEIYGELRSLIGQLRGVVGYNKKAQLLLSELDDACK